MIMGVAFFGPIYPTIPHIGTALLKDSSEARLAFMERSMPQNSDKYSSLIENYCHLG
jgi:hypothetical protein